MKKVDKRSIARKNSKSNKRRKNNEAKKLAKENKECRRSECRIEKTLCPVEKG